MVLSQKTLRLFLRTGGKANLTGLADAAAIAAALAAILALDEAVTYKVL